MPGIVNFWYTYIQIKLAYLQLITVLVYRNNSPKSHEQGYLYFEQKPWKIRVNEFIFTACNFTKNELLSMKFFKSCMIQMLVYQVCMNSLFYMVKLVESYKLYHQRFCLKVSEDFFYHGTSMLLQSTSLYICSNSKYVVHELFKIIQNYVNNNINN